MSDVFDLDAAADEAAKEPFRFSYKGRQWQLSHMSEVDWRVVENADSGEIGAIREAFHAGFGCVHDGENITHTEQAVEFDRQHQGITAMTILFGKWMKHAGLREGESAASPTSSGGTAGPSKRPSKRTTRGSGSGSSSPAN